MPGVDIIADHNPEAARPCRMQEKLQKIISSARFSSYLEMLSGASQHLVRWIVRCSGESGPGTGATPKHLRRTFVYGQGTSLWSTNGDDIGSIVFSNESQISVFSFSSRMYTRAAERPPSTLLTRVFARGRVSKCVSTICWFAYGHGC